MKLIGYVMACGLVGLLSTNLLRGDEVGSVPVRPRVQTPAPPTQIKGEVLIKAANVSMAHLVIPAKLLASLPVEKERRADVAPGRSQTVVAGIALSGALVVGGLQLVRRKNAGVRPAIILLTLSGAVVLAAASGVWADRAPAGGGVAQKSVATPDAPAGQPNPAAPGFALPVVIDIGGEGDQVTLTLSAPDAMKIQNFVGSHTSTHAQEPKDDPGAIQTPPHKQ